MACREEDKFDGRGAEYRAGAGIQAFGPCGQVRRGGRRGDAEPMAAMGPMMCPLFPEGADDSFKTL